ncbi:MAG: diguanylate cyclase [Actinomycetota bacterium]|nr:diguanylate cyclase [Actinomycetota bacterium]
MADLTPDRNQGADDRDRAAERRDQISELLDRASQARDERATVRDRRAEDRDEAAAGVHAGAAADRAGASRDRTGGASDRRHAADDRDAAVTDRVLSARERASAAVDELTGAQRRDAGMAELARATARAKRTQEPFVLAFIDVDDLKATNDSLGHAAGDQLLRRVVDTMRARLRPYDLIIRFGGDEFLCALPGAHLATATERFLLINSDLAAASHGSCTAGLAELEAQDSLDDLIERADAALRAERRQRSSTHSAAPSPRGGWGR